MDNIKNTILEAIGHTPLVKLNKIPHPNSATILVKCEFMNPSGSIKDRMALHIINDAEKKGLLKPGGTIIENTSGNTGLGLAMVAAVKGYKCIFTLPDKMSSEKINMLRAFGATVVVTPTDVPGDSPEHYVETAKRIARETPHAFYVNQYHNPANIEAHYCSTGPEIWDQTQGNFDYFVAGTGTGGTISGVGRYIKEANQKYQKNIKIVGVDPLGSVHYDLFYSKKLVEAQTYKVEGIGEDILCEALDFSVIDEMRQTTDLQAFTMARRLIREEGLLCGGSSGAIVHAAVELGKTLGPDQTIITVLTDSSSRYISKFLDDTWMQANGFLSATSASTPALEHTGFSTKAIHAGQKPDPSTGAIQVPIYQTSTYVQSSPGNPVAGYEYARTQNPIRQALEANLAALENGQHGICFASGCAAISAVLHLLSPGDHVVLCDDVYGGTFRLFNTVFKKMGIQFSLVDMTDMHTVHSAILTNTKLVWIETPTNPLLKIIDIEVIVKTVKQQNKAILIAVDNTFATPYLQTPLNLGADIVCHSTTKYLGGHSDVIGGVVIVNDQKLNTDLHFIQNAMGAIPGPQDCFLLLRSTKTLALRMQKHCENARILAEFLSTHPKVERVIYPGLASHPQHKIAKKQMRDFGGMISVVLKGDINDAKLFLQKTQLFALAESLGGVESLIEHPGIMTHASIPAEHRKKLGITDGLVRLSVGIEAVEDLQADLIQALG